MCDYIYIPPELVTNILTRLPVDDLLRCTSVCKSWYSLITSSHFISLHLNLLIPNQEPRVMFRTYNNTTYTSYSIHCDNQAFDEITELIYPLSRDLYIIGSSNGIFCLAHHSSKHIILWNPSIRKEVILTSPSVTKSLSLDNLDWYIGFGFVCATNDYKVVIISYLGSVLGAKNVNPIVYIYELSTGSWRLNLDSAADFSYKIHCGGSSPVFLNGRLHWFAKDYNKVGGNSKRVIASFDLSSEIFSTLMLPNVNTYECYLISFRESLCLIETRGPSCTILVMKEYGVTESWEMQFSIPNTYGSISPVNLQARSKLLFWIKDKGLFSYDTITLDVDCIYEREGLNASGLMHRYMESLVLIKHGKTTDRIQNSAHPKSENQIVKEPRVKKEHRWNFLRFFV